MLTTLRSGFVGLALLQACIVLSASASAADAPAGIVMAMNGRSEPPLLPMMEITANAPVRLEAGSKLTFLEYGRCKLVTVTGGVLTLTPSGYNTDGHVDGEADSPCPQTYSLASSGPGTGAPTTAALVMRGGAGPPHWPVNAQLLLTGSRGREFHTATVVAEDRPGSQPTSLTIADGKIAPAPGALPLLPNRRYVLRLIPADPSKSSELVFVASAVRQPQPLIILRLD
jgi:hypothetical protein